MIDQSLEQWLRERNRELDEWDAEAIRSQAAFVTGRFESYWQERAKLARERLEAIYDGPADESSTTDGSPPSRGDRQPRGDSGSGAGRSSEGGSSR